MSNIYPRVSFSYICHYLGTRCLEFLTYHFFLSLLSWNAANEMSVRYGKRNLFLAFPHCTPSWRNHITFFYNNEKNRLDVQDLLVNTFCMYYCIVQSLIGHFKKSGLSNLKIRSIFPVLNEWESEFKAVLYSVGTENKWKKCKRLSIKQ